MNGLIPLLIFLPLGAAILLTVLRGPGGSIARWGALLATVATLALSLVAASEYAALPPVGLDSSPVHPQLEFRQSWLTFPHDGGEVRLDALGFNRRRGFGPRSPRAPSAPPPDQRRPRAPPAPAA